MNNIIIITFSLVIALSSQKFDIKPWSLIIAPNHGWKEIKDVNIVESSKDNLSFEFKDSLTETFWNSYNISNNEDFQINFNFIDILPKSKIKQIKGHNGFKICISKKPIENAARDGKYEIIGKSIADSICFGVEWAKEDSKETLNLVIHKKIKGKEFIKSIRNIRVINREIKIKIEKIQNKLLFYIDNKIITNDEINEEFKQLIENEKLYIIISSEINNKSIINDLKLMKIFRPDVLEYENKIINNNLNSIIIKIKDKNNNNIPAKLIKEMNCYFDKS